MKAKLLTLLLCFFTLCVQGQVQKKRPIKSTTSKTKSTSTYRYESPKSNELTGHINGHGYVDLGLSVNWATCNVGAKRPSDYGGYYAWGETRTKSSYTRNNCFDDINNHDAFSDNYEIYNRYGGLTRITPTSGHDAARENWGGTWRMPTQAEFFDLCNKCKWIWTSKNGHNGYTVIGPNGNSIFLPAAGYRAGTGLHEVGETGFYWTSVLDFDSKYAECLCFFARYDTGSVRRFRGQSIRPVSDPTTSNTKTTLTKTETSTSKPKPTTNSKTASLTLSKPTGYVNEHGYVDLGLSVKWATCNVGATSSSDYGGYYAWGESSTKSSYTWNNCFDSLDSTGESWETYKLEGQTRITPTSGHDTARENWGGTWRIPTDAECEELCNKCKWAWTSKNGHNGYIVIGPNGNNIFLPAAGYLYGTDSRGVGTHGFYWSSTLSPSNSSLACYLEFLDIYHGLNYYYRKYGRSVRPVTE